MYTKDMEDVENLRNFTELSSGLLWSDVPNCHNTTFCKPQLLVGYLALILKLQLIQFRKKLKPSSFNLSMEY